MISPARHPFAGRHTPENDPDIAATFTVTPICISAHEAETGAAITKAAEERISRTCGTGALIHKQGSPYWYAKWWQNGRQFCVSTEEATIMKAEQSLQRFMGRKAVGLPIPEVLKLRYEDPRNSLMENWRVQGRKSLSGPADEPQYTPLKHLDALFKNWRVSAITADAVRKYARERKDAGAAIGTINRSLSALKRMFHIGVADGKLAVIPHIEMLPEAPARKGFLEVEQFHRLCEFLSKHLRPVLTMGYYTGMRLGEVRNLKWENVDLVEKSIRLYDDETKTGEPRIVPLIGELPEMFKTLRQQSRWDYVFSDGAPLGSFRKAWQTACVMANLGKKEAPLENGYVPHSGITPNDLRRSGVRNLIRSGVPEKIAMAISGHKTRAVFDRYNIVSERDVTEAGAKVTAYLEAQTAKGKAVKVEKVQVENGESTVKVGMIQYAKSLRGCSSAG